MSAPFNLAENIVGAFEAVNNVNSAKSAFEFLTSLQQAAGYFGAVALYPKTAGLAIATNSMAASATIGKILTDYKKLGRINTGDLGSLAGNLSVISAAVALSVNPISRVAQISTTIGRGIGWIGASSYFTGNANASELNPIINSSFFTATRSRPAPRDPLAIDLDGDGIETVGIVQGGNPVLFDHDADGTRTGTGWLRRDDAWLVLDRNGNGTIDSGRELFGVDTLISGKPGTASAVYARNGFEALSTLDSNGDRVFNAKDSAFT